MQTPELDTYAKVLLNRAERNLRDMIEKEEREAKTTYEEFLGMVKFENGRALIGGYTASLIGSDQSKKPYFYEDISFTLVMKFKDQLEKDGYRIITLDESTNFFRIKNNRYIYQPKQSFRIWRELNPIKYALYCYLGLIISILIMVSVIVYRQSLLNLN